MLIELFYLEAMNQVKYKYVDFYFIVQKVLISDVGNNLPF